LKTFSSNYLATEFEIDRATAVRVLKGIEPDQELTPGRPTYKTATFATALEIHRARNASNAYDGGDGSAESDTASLTAARVRIALANAESKERQNKIVAGQFLDAFAIADMLGPVIATMREVALSLPGKISDALASYCTQTVADALATGQLTADSLESCRSYVFSIIQDEVYENLNNLGSPETYIETQRKIFGSKPVEQGDGNVEN
jgi:hypothetical protein